MGYIHKGIIYKTRKKKNIFVELISIFIFFLVVYFIFFFFLDLCKVDDNSFLNPSKNFLKDKYFVLYNNGFVNLNIDYNDIIIYSTSNFSFKEYYFNRVLNRLTFGVFFRSFNKKYHLNLYRIVGKPNDIINIKDGKLFVNNKFVKNVNLPVYYNNVKFRLFDNEIFCISIEKNNYFDSLIIGAMSEKNITGKVIY